MNNMISTSNYWNFTDIEYSASIAGYAPDFYAGPHYKKLAPYFSFFNEYKTTGNKDYYIEQYNKLVLAKLDPLKVFNELTLNNEHQVVMLCWEKPGEFCHRRLVAEWLEKNLNITVPEI